MPKTLEIRVKCICGHLGVDRGELGIIVESAEGGFSSIVKWDNGFKESIEFDNIEILKGNK
ncbi:MAG: hypothetical protein WC915_06760 [archaeon]|jgi:hypothetical protein